MFLECSIGDIAAFAGNKNLKSLNMNGCSNIKGRFREHSAKYQFFNHVRFVL